MPVLGISVALLAAFLFGAALVWFCMNHIINQAIFENDDLRHANTRLINELRADR